MSSGYQDTPFRIRASALDPSFELSPQEFFDAMVERMSIVAPTGYYGIVVSDSEPESNIGLWLRGGTKPYVWNESTNQYVPLDISDSLASVLSAISALQTLTSTHTGQITALQSLTTAQGVSITALQALFAKGRVVIQYPTPLADDYGAVWFQTNVGGTVITAIKWWNGTTWSTVVSFPIVTEYVTAVGDRQNFPATSGVVEFTHGLGTRPKEWSVGIICTSADAGYAVGDYLPYQSVLRTTLSESDPRHTAYANDTKIVFIRPLNTGLDITPAVLNPTTLENVAIDVTKWKVTAYARL